MKKKIDCVRVSLGWEKSLIVDPKDIGTLIQLLSRSTLCIKKYHAGDYVDVTDHTPLKFEQGTFTIYDQEGYDEAEAELKRKEAESQTT